MDRPTAESAAKGGSASRRTGQPAPRTERQVDRARWPAETRGDAVATGTTRSGVQLPRALGCANPGTHGSIIGVRTSCFFIAYVWLGVLTSFGQSDWTDTLALMPLPGGHNP